MTRISRNELNAQIAKLISQRSTCNRLKVGCIIVRDNRVISTAYNGSLDGHCTPENCNENHPCKNTVHAEANAIAFAAKGGISLKGSELYCTHAPCKDCAKLIIQSGITTVYYQQEYRSKEGVELLLSKGIKVY